MSKFKAGESGNPAGKPVGSKDKRTALRALLNPHAPALVQKAVDMALEGDTTALRLCLDRCIAPLRSTTQNITLNFEGELHERGEATLQAIYAGDIDPLTGSALIGALADQARLKEQTELEARLSHLENKL